MSDGPKNTQQIAERLPNVPKSTLYRHMKLLLEGGVVVVTETRLVQGIVEKVYRISTPPHLQGEDLKDRTAEEHLDYFTIYITTLLQGFSEYLDQKKEPDMAKDRAGYNEIMFWASSDELDAFARKLNEILTPLLEKSQSPSRHLHKLAIITHPIKSRGD